ncbi:MAG: long-chain fatty acid--CoA ligase [Ignavibacteria bacterium]|jgi:fatty-acyl-CoA synthase
MYIGDYLARRCVYTPDNIALTDITVMPQKSYTYSNLNHRANKLANWLRSNGIEKGDIVSILAYDSIYHYDLFFACSKLGAVFAPLNWRLNQKEIEYQIRLISPKIHFNSSEEPMNKVKEYLSGLSEMPKILGTVNNDIVNLKKIIKDTIDEPVRCESLKEQDTACLFFTGGTTGLPKAAQMSHSQIAWNTFNSNLGGVLGTDTFLNIFPLFHCGGLFAFSVPILIQGGKVIQTKKFDPVEVLTTIEKEKATIFGGVPTMFQMLTSAPNWDKVDLSSLRYCMSGGAPMPVSLIQKYHKEKSVVFRQGFGMTEFGPGVFSLASEDAEIKAGSIGKPNFFVDARVVDIESNLPLPVNEVGELVLRGPTAMTGYFNNSEATKKVFDDESYLHTGDLAYIDKDGYFFIVDRLKDMFISGGENVFPAEIEEVLYKNDSVAMCAVIGVNDKKWGQVGKAFVVLKEGKAVSEEELLEYLNSNLTRYKIPKSIVFKENLPISGAGKILKTELRKIES